MDVDFGFHEVKAQGDRQRLTEAKVLSWFPRSKPKKAIHVAMKHEVSCYEVFLNVVRRLVKQRRLADEGFAEADGLYKQYRRK